MEKRSKIILWIWDICLALTVMLCLSCGSPDTSKAPVETKSDALLEYNYCRYNKHVTWEEVDKILKFEYSGHRYIQFNLHQSHYVSISVVHDPDCPCHQINQ